jgi:CheY-like chemotaxis protein
VIDDLRALIDWEASGFQLSGWATNVTESLRLAEKFSPDIAIMDISLPEMDGLKLTEKLRAIVPGLTVIVLSGYMDFSYAKRAIDLGVVTYLVKHELTSEKLIDTLRKARQEIERGERGRALIRRQALIRLLQGGGGVPTELARGVLLAVIMPAVSPILDVRNLRALLQDAAERLPGELPEDVASLDALVVDDQLMVAIALDSPVNSLGAYREFARSRVRELLDRLNAPGSALAVDRPLSGASLSAACALFQRHRFDYLFMTPGSIELLGLANAPVPAPQDLSALHLERLRREPAAAREQVERLLNDALQARDGMALARLAQHLSPLIETLLAQAGLPAPECPAQAEGVASYLLDALDALIRRFNARSEYSAITLYAIRYLETNYNL